MDNIKKSPDTTDSGKQKRKNDIILIVSFLTVILLSVLLLFLFRTEGDSVIVSVNGKVYGEYSLNTDTEVEIKSGDGYNVLVIKDGEAFVKSASCRDGICSSHRHIRYNGESIICLPNDVVIEIRSQDRDQPKQPDITV